MVRSPAVPPRSRVPDAARLLELIDGFAEQPILVLGDLVADRFIRGTPKRISREAPVLILRHDGEELVPGGGANAVANLHALGGRPLPVGFVGDDEAGRALLDLFAGRGIPIDGILVRRGYRTACKTRVLAGARHAIKQQVVRFDIEDPLAALRRRARRARAPPVRALDPLPRVRALGLRPRRRRSGARDGARGSRRAGPHRRQPLPARRPARPRRRHAQRRGARGRSKERRARSSTRGERLRARLDVRFLLLTRGSHGMILFADGEAVSIPVHGTDQVADVTGAGDTVLGAFALAVAAGATALEAALLANYAGGVVVMKTGTATLDRDELR